VVPPEKAMRARTENTLLVLLGVLILYLSKDIFMINTGDWFRAIGTIVDLKANNVNAYDRVMPTALTLREHFGLLRDNEYVSAYSYLIHGYGVLLKLITSTLDIQLLAAALKAVYVYVLYRVFVGIGVPSGGWRVPLFAVCALPMFASSNLGFFPYFYQEQLLFIALPVMALYFLTPSRPATTCAFLVAMLLAACAKSQFFYLPLLAAPFVAYKLGWRGALKVNLGLAAIQVLAILCIVGSGNALNLNRYHATYFGVYVYMRDAGMDISHVPNPQCIGVDTWGDTYDYEQGAVPSQVGSRCIELNRDASFGDAVRAMLMNPGMVFGLLADKKFIDQFRTNYFHVYKKNQLIVSPPGNGLHGLTLIKDTLTQQLKSFGTFFLALVFLWRPLRRLFPAALFVMLVFYSQIYISFLGEGYRDLSKHLSVANLAFDLLLFLLFAGLVAAVVRRSTKYHDGNPD